MRLEIIPRPRLDVKGCSLPDNILNGVDDLGIEQASDDTRICQYGSACFLFEVNPDNVFFFRSQAFEPAFDLPMKEESFVYFSKKIRDGFEATCHDRAENYHAGKYKDCAQIRMSLLPEIPDTYAYKSVRGINEYAGGDRYRNEIVFRCFDKIKNIFFNKFYHCISNKLIYEWVCFYFLINALLQGLLRYGAIVNCFKLPHS